MAEAGSVPTTRPSLRTVMVSHRSKISFSRLDTYRMAVPRARSRRTIA